MVVHGPGESWPVAPVCPILCRFIRMRVMRAPPRALRCSLRRRRGNGSHRDPAPRRGRDRRDPPGCPHGRHRPRVVGPRRPRRPGLRLRSSAGGAADHVDVHHPVGDHRRLDDAGRRWDRLPGRGRQEAPQEAARLHRADRPDRRLHLHAGRRDRLHLLPADPGDLRGGLRQHGATRTPPGRGQHRVAVRHHRQPGQRRDGHDGGHPRPGRLRHHRHPDRDPAGQHRRPAVRLLPADARGQGAGGRPGVPEASGGG